MIAYDLNSAILALGDWASINGGDQPELMPLYAYADSQAPFITYSQIPSIMSKENYYMYFDKVLYYIYDNNIDRMHKITEELKRILNVGDDIAQIKANTTAGTNYRITSCALVTGFEGIPQEREGFSYSAVQFEVGYVLL